jgi:peptidoglycan hydrolase-like protein with peptidoglycan-binding domain
MTLKMGMSGPNVRDLQEMLNLKIPSQPLLKIDGIFGPETSARVVMFQKQVHLVADGVVGRLTNMALVSAVVATLAAGTGSRR